MIFTKLAEGYILTPYKRYNIIVTCNNLRRLTVIEWTIFHIIGEFKVHPIYKNHNLTFFLETVLGMTASEPLIKPCIDSMIKSKYIEIANYSPFIEVSTIPLSSICLTPLGLDILKRGYVPGSTQDFSEVVYYDLLMGMAYDRKPADYGRQPTAVSIVSQSHISFDFPSEAILSGMNSGLLFNTKYRNSHSEAAAVKCSEDTNLWRTEKLIISIDATGAISYNLPNIPSVISLVKRILSFSYTTSFSAQNIDVSNGLPKAFSVGSNIPLQLESWLKSMDIAFLDIETYRYLENAHVSINCKTIFIFRASSFSVQKVTFQSIIYIPISLPDPPAIFAWEDGSYLKMGIIQGNLNGIHQPISLVYRSNKKLSISALIQDAICVGDLNKAPYSEILCKFSVFGLTESDFIELCKQHLSEIDAPEKRRSYLIELDQIYRNTFGHSLPSGFMAEQLS